MSAHIREEETVITQDCGLERTKVHKLIEHAEQEMFGMKRCIKSWTRCKFQPNGKKKKNEKCLYNLPEP